MVSESSPLCATPVCPQQLSPGSSVILFAAGRNRNRNAFWVSCLVFVLLARADLCHVRGTVSLF